MITKAARDCSRKDLKLHLKSFKDFVESKKMIIESLRNRSGIALKSAWSSPKDYSNCNCPEVFPEILLIRPRIAPSLN